MHAMRLFLAAALTGGALLLPAVPASAHGPDEIQIVSGEILLPTRFPNTATTSVDNGWPGVGRRLWDLAGANADGVIATIFDVDPATFGGHFTLDVTGDALGNADLGVYFYTEMGDTAGSITPITTAEYGNNALGGEAGAIPAEARKALVYVQDGVDVFFSYHGFSAPEVHISATGYDHDVTIQAGQVLTWVNDDAAGHSVTSDVVIDADTDARLFDSSPKLTQPIVEGGVFKYQFFDAGTYTYFDKFSEATGTVTVVGEFGFPAG